MKKKTIHLCAPWPVNEDSCIYGIDLYEYDESSHEWHRRFFVEFEKEYQRNGFGCVFVNNKLYLLGGEQCTLNMERLRILYYDEVSGIRFIEYTALNDVSFQFFSARWNRMI